MKSVLVIAPHPDDEILGLGGFLASGLEDGKNRSIVYLTDGEASSPAIPAEVIRLNRLRLSDEVINLLGIPQNHVYRTRMSDGKIPFPNERDYGISSEKLKTIIQQVNPDTVFVTGSTEVWPFDHLAAFQMTSRVLKEIEFAGNFYSYWVWTWCNFPISRHSTLNRNKIQRIDVRPFIKIKHKLIGMYLNEKSANGEPFSGRLPWALLKTSKYPYEIAHLENEQG
ncbi:MAG: PIG-L family deacetylase [Bacteroidetes bacterium]|nr:PIG-L family deacetylase [Bacteroidota bacterium]